MFMFYQVFLMDSEWHRFLTGFQQCVFFLRHWPPPLTLNSSDAKVVIINTSCVMNNAQNKDSNIPRADREVFHGLKTATLTLHQTVGTLNHSPIGPSDQGGHLGRGWQGGGICPPDFENSDFLCFCPQFVCFFIFYLGKLYFYFFHILLRKSVKILPPLEKLKWRPCIGHYSVLTSRVKVSHYSQHYTYLPRLDLYV